MLTLRRVRTDTDTPRRALVRPDGDSRRRGLARLELLLAFFLIAFSAWYGACRLGSEKGFVADSAYVTFTYARNLVEGRAGHFNPSDPEPTPGVSSEALVRFNAAALALGFDPLIATRALSLACVLAIGLLFGYVAARVVHAPLTTGMLVGSAASWGLMVMPETGMHLASGMETLLFSLLHALVFAWVTWAVARDPAPGARVAAVGAVVLGALVFTRPEGWILALAYTGALVAARIPRGGFRHSLRECRTVIVVAVLVVVAMFAWRAWTYGAFLPNPYFVKSSNAIFGGTGGLLPGWTYVLRFIVLRLVPAMLVVGFAAGVLAFEARVWVPAIVLLTPSVIVLGLYTRAIHDMAGGFRYEYPLLIPWLGAGVAALVALSLRSRITYRALLASAVFVVPALAAPVRPALWDYVRHVRTNALQWIDRRPLENALSRAGRDLAETGLGERATVLLSSPGQIPWYSRFKAVDWIGSNETKLSGREALGIEEAWQYLESKKPDVVQSFLPPAAALDSTPATDANFRSKLVRATLAGRGWGLVQHWNPEKVEQMAFRQMQWVREHCVFGACYFRDDASDEDRWVFLYVVKESPHREALLAALRGSKRADRDPDLSRVFPFDPRLLTE
jgi:hypothetical protein